MPSFAQQVWRALRLGGAAFAAQYAAYGVTHPKQAYVAGGIAAAEVIYRALVPPAEQSTLAKYWAAIRATVATAGGTSTTSTTSTTTTSVPKV